MPVRDLGNPLEKQKLARRCAPVGRSIFIPVFGGPIRQTIRFTPAHPLRRARVSQNECQNQDAKRLFRPLVKRKLPRFKVATTISNRVGQCVTERLLLGLQMPFCPFFTKSAEEPKPTALK